MTRRVSYRSNCSFDQITSCLQIQTTKHFGHKTELSHLFTYQFRTESKAFALIIQFNLPASILKIIELEHALKRSITLAELSRTSNIWRVLHSSHRVTSRIANTQLTRICALQRQKSISHREQTFNVHSDLAARAQQLSN